MRAEVEVESLRQLWGLDAKPLSTHLENVRRFRFLYDLQSLCSYEIGTVSSLASST